MRKFIGKYKVRVHKKDFEIDKEVYFDSKKEAVAYAKGAWVKTDCYIEVYQIHEDHLTMAWSQVPTEMNEHNLAWSAGPAIANKSVETEKCGSDFADINSLIAWYNGHPGNPDINKLLADFNHHNNTEYITLHAGHCEMLLHRIRKVINTAGNTQIGHALWDSIINDCAGVPVLNVADVIALLQEREKYKIAMGDGGGQYDLTLTNSVGEAGTVSFKNLGDAIDCAKAYGVIITDSQENGAIVWNGKVIGAKKISNPPAGDIPNQKYLIASGDEAVYVKTGKEERDVMNAIYELTDKIDEKYFDGKAQKSDIHKAVCKQIFKHYRDYENTFDTGRHGFAVFAVCQCNCLVELLLGPTNYTGKETHGITKETPDDIARNSGWRDEGKTKGEERNEQ